MNNSEKKVPDGARAEVESDASTAHVLLGSSQNGKQCLQAPVQQLLTRSPSRVYQGYRWCMKQMIAACPPTAQANIQTTEGHFETTAMKCIESRRSKIKLCRPSWSFCGPQLNSLLVCIVLKDVWLFFSFILGNHDHRHVRHRFRVPEPKSRFDPF